MNLRRDKILKFCIELKLDGIRYEYATICQRCAKEELSFTDCLEKLLTAESISRAIKTLDDFEFAQGAPKKQLARTV